MNFTQFKKLIGTVSAGFLLVMIVFFLFVFIISRSGIGLSTEDRYFMNLAYEEAELAEGTGDAKIGAVLVVNGDVIARAHNTVFLEGDFRNHAEMLVISDSLKILNVSSFRHVQGDTVLYTTLEPCSMCEGYIVYKRIPRVVFGTKSTKSFKEVFFDNYMGHLKYRINQRWFGNG